jgi:CoA:oxalate CoA-transferase
VDLATGTSAALAITAAWHAGEGCHLDMSMLDAAVAWSRAKPSALRPGPEPTYGTLRTADGRVVIALLEDAMWTRLCTALGWADWADAARLARYPDRQRHAPEIRHRLEREIGRRPTSEVLALAREHDLPLGPADATDDPAAREQVALRFPPGALAHLPLPGLLLAPLTPAPGLGTHDPVSHH